MRLKDSGAGPTPSITFPRARLGLAGGLRRLQLAGEGGLRHTRNAGHVSGRTRTTFEGRVTATIGFTLGKANQ